LFTGIPFVSITLYRTRKKKLQLVFDRAVRFLEGIKHRVPGREPRSSPLTPLPAANAAGSPVAKFNSSVRLNKIRNLIGLKSKVDLLVIFLANL